MTKLSGETFSMTRITKPELPIQFSVYKNYACARV